jgi:hypothetical protein
MLANRWRGLGLPREAQPKASRANPQENRRSLRHAGPGATNLAVIFASRWGGLGEERRSLPPRSGQT